MSIAWTSIPRSARIQTASIGEQQRERLLSDRSARAGACAGHGRTAAVGDLDNERGIAHQFLHVLDERLEVGLPYAVQVDREADERDHVVRGAAAEELVDDDLIGNALDRLVEDREARAAEPRHAPVQ
ncbi:MAG: hypothetical protein AB7H93_07670 [Vicinamibacterales bacterium]